MNLGALLLSAQQKAERSANISAAVKLAHEEDPKIRARISKAMSGRVHDDARRALTSDCLRRARIDHPEKFVQTEAQRSWLDLLHKANIGRKSSPESRERSRQGQLRRQAKIRAEKK
jgi:hypothetical protein